VEIGDSPRRHRDTEKSKEMASRSAENGSKAKIFTADPRGFSRAPWELSSEESEEAEDAKGAIQKTFATLTPFAV
jgi:hypothetical protein